MRAALGRPGANGEHPWSVERFHELTAGMTAGEKLDVFLDLDEPCQRFLWDEIQRDSMNGAAA